MNFLIKRLTQPCGLGFRSIFFCSTSKKKLIEKHEAILASIIIQKIKQEPVTSKKDNTTEKTEIYNDVLPSLRSEVIKMIKDYSISHVEKRTIKEISKKNEEKDSLETAKKNMLKYFDGGVLVDGNLCIQERFFSELNQDENNKTQQVKVKKLTFCPTYLVTGQVFRTLSLSNDFLLITGHFGIGKTYSFMLYHLLSDFIYRYLHEYCKQNDTIPQGINKKFPKLVYWNIDIEQIGKIEGENIINKIIAEQCFELTSIESNYQFFKQQGNKFDLENFYLKKNIRIKLIIDQINVVASALRNNNTLIQLNNQFRKKYQDIKQETDKDPSKKYQLDRQKEDIISKYFGSEKKVKQKYILADKLIDMVQGLRKNFGTAYFLSSRDIEVSLMKKLNLNGRDSHARIFKKKLKYEQLSQTPQNLADLSQFFVFLLMIKFKQLNKEEFTKKQNQIIIKIKQIVIKRFKKQRLLLLPFTVSSAILSKQQEDLQEIINQILTKNLPEKQLQKNIYEIILIINERSKAYLSELINIFLDKSEHKLKSFRKVSRGKKILLLKLLYAAKAKAEEIKQNYNQNSKKDFIEIDVSNFFDSSKAKQREQITSNLSKNLGYYKGKGKFCFLVNQQVLLQILQEQETSLLESLFESNERIYNLFQTRVSKGLYIETLLRRCLSQIGTQLILKKEQGSDKLTFSPIKKTKLLFKSIPRSNSPIYNNFSFLSAFQQSLKQGCCFYMPSKQILNDQNQQNEAIQQEKIDEASKKIDFVLTQRDAKKTFIRAFDVTINMEGVQKKIFEFFYEFSNFQDKEQQTIHLQKQMDVELQYFVFVPKLLPNPIQWKAKIIDKVIQKLTKNLKAIQQKMKSYIKEIKQLKNQIKETKKLNRNIEAIRKLNQNIKGIENLNSELEVIIKLNKNIKSLEKKINRCELQIERIPKRTQFLKSLSSQDKNLKQNKSSLEIIRNEKFKTLLTKVSVVSCFDAQFTNQDPIKIAFYKSLLEQAKKDFEKNEK